MEPNKKYVNGEGLDALDALLLFGYKVVKESPGKFGSMVTGGDYRLCSAKADMSFKSSISDLLIELSEAELYYKKRLNEEGKKIL